MKKILYKLESIIDSMRRKFRKDKYDSLYDDLSINTSMPIYMPTYTTITGATGGAGTISTGPNLQSSYTILNGAVNINGDEIFSLYDNYGNQLLKIKKDGEIEWLREIKENEAAELFSSSLFLSAESKAGMTSVVKSKIRDQVFEYVISAATERGPLSAEELTYLYEASKIIEKLKL